MKSPFVSVIIPTYNRSHFLSEAIESVLNQSFQDIELIIVDDGSTDQTPTVLMKYERRPHVVVIRQENRGVSCARNVGISRATADWISFLDSDDQWLPRKLESQYDVIQKDSKIRFCQTEELWMRHGKRINPMKKHQKYSGWIFEKCIPLCIVSPSSVMIHREVFDRCGLFDEKLVVCEDYDMWLRISLEYPLLTLPELLIIKRGGHVDQLSHKYWGMDRFRIYALQKILKHPKLDNEQRRLVEADILRRISILQKGAEKRAFFC